jgi:hypothetical protein
VGILYKNILACDGLNKQNRRTEKNKTEKERKRMKKREGKKEKIRKCAYG